MVCYQSAKAIVAIDGGFQNQILPVAAWNHARSDKKVQSIASAVDLAQLRKQHVSAPALSHGNIVKGSWTYILLDGLAPALQKGLAFTWF